ncbi:CFI-box-CTERM domain-containing protein [Halosegnis sp.]|uniref:CFI-box-CTERM domain-containing protein n=1 Tax=Halosegnis sp. TaxID=2864959 RepID=UPI0035D449D8
MSEDSEPDNERFDAMVGDGREKHLTLHTVDGERIERGDVFVKHGADAYVCSPDPEFPPEETERFEKTDLRRVDLNQHHSTCFITTAAGDERALSALRGFREDVLAPTRTGRALVGIYERVSPPVACTLVAAPDSRTTRVVAGLVDVCARLARRRRAAGLLRPLLSMLLVGLYVVGLACGLAGHVVHTVAAGSAEEAGKTLAGPVAEPARVVEGNAVAVEEGP